MKIKNFLYKYQGYSNKMTVAFWLSILGIVKPTEAPMYVGSHTTNFSPFRER